MSGIATTLRCQYVSLVYCITECESDVKYSFFFPIELFDTVFMDRNNIVIDIDQMVDGRCIICLQVLSNVVACVSAPMGFILDMKSYISCFGTWSGYKIQISLVYSACQHFSGHDQP